MEPSNLREEVLNRLHRDHLGISEMKIRTNKLLYWPGINKDIENTGAKCDACRNMQMRKPRNINSSLFSSVIV